MYQLAVALFAIFMVATFPVWATFYGAAAFSRSMTETKGAQLRSPGMMTKSAKAPAGMQFALIVLLTCVVALWVFGAQ